MKCRTFLLFEGCVFALLTSAVSEKSTTLPSVSNNSFLRNRSEDIDLQLANNETVFNNSFLNNNDIYNTSRNPIKWSRVITEQVTIDASVREEGLQNAGVKTSLSETDNSTTFRGETTQNDSEYGAEDRTLPTAIDKSMDDIFPRTLLETSTEGEKNQISGFATNEIDGKGPRNEHFRLHWISDSFNNNQSKLESYNDVSSSELPLMTTLKTSHEYLNLMQELDFSRLSQKRKSIEREALTFEPTPEGKPYEMEIKEENNDVFVFAYLGQFLSLIQPYDFPVEFVRDAIWKKLSVVSIIMQALRVEAGFIACLTIGFLLSLVVPVTAIASTCSNLCEPRKQDIDSGSVCSKTNFNRRSHIVTLFFAVLMIGLGIAAMLVTNEELSAAVLKTPKVVNAAFNDAATFVTNTKEQITHIALKGLDTTIDAITSDLNGAEKLLGEPIQLEVATETGVDVALDALVDVAKVTEAISEKLTKIHQVSLKVRDMISETKDRLKDIRHQVESLRRACPAKDRPLCDTIDPSGVEISFSMDKLNSDPRLGILRTISVGSLRQLAERMRSRFANMPADISERTRGAREHIIREINFQKSILERNIWPFEAMAGELTDKIDGAKSYTTLIEESASDVEQWRWLSVLVLSLLVLLIWLLLFLALVYGCCDGEEKGRSILIGSLVIMSLFSIALWAVALACFIFGGHGEVFICRPLYDNPQYKSLTELLDDPGILYHRDGGFIKNLLTGNQTWNVPIRSILNQCEENQPTYDSFQLKSIFDLEAATDYAKWRERDMFSKLNELDRNFTRWQFLDSELQEKLQHLLQATAVNMTNHRTQMSKPLTGKDLTSFAKQMDSVANQIKDLSTASRVETLAARTRRAISTHLDPIETKKEELLYLVTALEIQINPLQRQVNQSISHLKTIQYYIDNQGSNIFEMKIRDYTERLRQYLYQYKDYLLKSLRADQASCLPFWNVFHGVRNHMCRQIMDPLNGFWFALIWCLVWLIIATPVCIKLIHYFDHVKGQLLSSSLNSFNSTERGANWRSPGAEEANSWR